MIGLIATVINFLFNPGAIQFLGFTVASIVFDTLSWLVGYDRMFKTPSYSLISFIVISTLSAALAGFVIATFSLNMTTSRLTSWGGVLSWAMLHAVGGVIGGIIGFLVVTALLARDIQT